MQPVARGSAFGPGRGGGLNSGACRRMRGKVAQQGLLKKRKGVVGSRLRLRRGRRGGIGRREKGLKIRTEDRMRMELKIRQPFLHG